MNEILSIELGNSRKAGIIALKLFRVFLITIVGAVDEGKHFHLGFRLFKYELAIQLHNHEANTDSEEIIKKGNE